MVSARILQRDFPMPIPDYQSLMLPVLRIAAEGARLGEDDATLRALLLTVDEACTAPHDA